MKQKRRPDCQNAAFAIIVAGHPDQGRRPCGQTPSGTTATQPATAVSTNARVLVKANQATNRVAQPTNPTTTTDPNGEITPPLLCPVTTTTTIDTLKVDSCAGKAAAQALPIAF